VVVPLIYPGGVYLSHTRVVYMPVSHTRVGVYASHIPGCGTDMLPGVWYRHATRGVFHAPFGQECASLIGDSLGLGQPLLARVPESVSDRCVPFCTFLSGMWASRRRDVG